MRQATTGQAATRRLNELTVRPILPDRLVFEHSHFAEEIALAKHRAQAFEEVEAQRCEKACNV
jgi:hypothetical protein